MKHDDIEPLTNAGVNEVARNPDSYAELRLVATVKKWQAQAAAAEARIAVLEAALANVEHVVAAQRVAEEREACAKICDAANEANAKRAKYAAEIETRAEYRAARAEAGSLSAAIRARGAK